MRFQAELTARDAAMLQSLMRELELQSNAELLSQALALMKWLVSERRQGRKIASLGAQGPVRELAAPLLERIAPEYELPYAEIHWTSGELKQVAKLLSAEPPAPVPRLVRAMKRLRR